MLRVVVLFTAVLSVTPLGLPNYITSCSRNDPNLNKCALNSAKESIHQFSLGDVERELPSLDPLFVSEMKVYVPNESGLKILFKNNYFKGLSKLELQDIKFDLDKKLIAADAIVNLDVNNVYEVSGKILLIPIRSAGDATIKLKNTVLRIHIWYEHVILEDGKTHWNITKHDVNYDVEKAIFRLENLLNDKNISDQINKIINEFWREIVDEVGPSICNTLADSVINNLSILLNQVPYDELMPE